MEAFRQSGLEDFRLSATLRAILQSDAMDVESSVATFIRAIRRMPPNRQSAVEVVQRLFGRIDSSSAPDAVEFADSDVAPFTSAGLREAFEEATALRKRVGGKDDYLGLRHVLFAIFGSTSGSLAEEAASVLFSAGVDRGSAVRIAYDFCIGHLEETESADAWRAELEHPGVASSEAESPEMGIALLHSDDPWAHDVEDRTGATQEAEAFAAMIMAKQFEPPLAVGIFGEWGSGKSLFMRQLHRAIEGRTFLKAGEPTSGDVVFHRNVVQIRFNAWHYVETNLWASLVDQIFTGLDRWAVAKEGHAASLTLFGRLATARTLTLEAAEALVKRRRDVTAAAKTLAAAEEAYIAKRESVEAMPRTYAMAAFKKAVETEGTKERLEGAVRELGLDQMTAGADDLEKAVDAFGKEATRYSTFASRLLQNRNAPLVIIGIAVSIVILPPLFAMLVQNLTSSAVAVASALSGILAPMALGMSFLARSTGKAVSVLRAFRRQFEREIDELTAADKANRETEKARLAAAKAAALEAAEDLKTATDKAAEAARKYHNEDGRGRVLRFVRDRIADGAYAKHLSFVATVRKDFEELSRLMAYASQTDIASKTLGRSQQKALDEFLSQHGDDLKTDERSELRKALSEPQDNVPVFDRIVLYVDDLDRCPPEQVLVVLQAIHLLLAFPIFVVFVAVDVRWLRESLIQRHRGQLGQESGNGGATASDYLEKIFQIPYWVRPMSVANTQALLGDRMGPVAPPSAAQREREPASAAMEGTVTKISSPSTDTNSSGFPPVEPPSRASRLRLTDAERAFVAEMAKVLDGLPRRTLRFINTYRIIKASLGAADRRELEREGYKALLAMLAVSIAADDCFPDLLANLCDAKDPYVTVKMVDLVPEGGRDAIWDRVRSSLEAIEDADIAGVAHYARLAARFSFQNPVLHWPLAPEGPPSPQR